MTALQASLVIGGATLFLSVITSVALVAFTYGQLRADVRQLQASRAELATKADVRLVEVQLAEIKGMFRLELRPSAAPSGPATAAEQAS